MTSLSNLIKSTSYVPLRVVKQLEASLYAPARETGSGESNDGSGESGQESDKSAVRIRDEARKEAEAILETARTEAARMTEQARQEAETWWQDRRNEDNTFREQIREAAYAEGFEAGRKDAERAVLEQYAAQIEEGRTVLEQAHEAARRIIAESEPFLVELSCAIAAKIVGRKLEESPDLAVELVREALKRTASKENILLCVAPSQFAYIQSVRDELASVIDAEAELVIVPDHSVKDQGCVVKTSFGTVDARVETQLSEIKQALLDLCLREDRHGE